MSRSRPVVRSRSPPAPTMPGPRIELKELDVFLGHWSCKGQVAASPMCPARSNESDVKIERALGGYWLALDLHEKKSARSP